MMEKKFASLAMNEDHPLWREMTFRQNDLYAREGDVRSPFARDYTRILHSQGYRRMKHKTQVFFNIDNDHICTRMEHVSHVDSVSYTIASYLGLNTELTRAISIGHDIGHAPFGHQGETVLNDISRKYLGREFWHERNGLHFVDEVELLADDYNEKKNLDLTYAVRDGIISHCGELDQNGIRPRSELIDLEKDFTKKGQYQPATWEGCVVKLADKIAYVGRDIEDAKTLGFLGDEAQNMLIEMARANGGKAVNTTVIMNNMITDICNTSSPDRGICFSEKFSRQLDDIKNFNYQYIYSNNRFKPYEKYSRLVLTEIFESLYDLYDGRSTWDSLREEKPYRPETIRSFMRWLAEYCDVKNVPKEGQLRERALMCKNKKIYHDLSDKKDYIQAVLDYIAGMTDRFAIKVFNELLKY